MFTKKYKFDNSKLNDEFDSIYTVLNQVKKQIAPIQINPAYLISNSQIPYDTINLTVIFEFLITPFIAALPINVIEIGIIVKTTDTNPIYEFGVYDSLGNLVFKTKKVSLPISGFIKLSIGRYNLRSGQYYFGAWGHNGTASIAMGVISQTSGIPIGTFLPNNGRIIASNNFTSFPKSINFTAIVPTPLPFFPLFFLIGTSS